MWVLRWPHSRQIHPPGPRPAVARKVSFLLLLQTAPQVSCLSCSSCRQPLWLVVSPAPASDIPSPLVVHTASFADSPLMLYVVITTFNEHSLQLTLPVRLPSHFPLYNRQLSDRQSLYSLISLFREKCFVKNGDVFCREDFFR